MNIGKAVRSQRVQKNLSVRELAVITGLSPGTISKIENEKTVPSVITIKNIANSMGVNVAKFFIDDKEDFVEVVKKGSRNIVIGNNGQKEDICKELLFNNKSINMKPEIITLTPKSIYRGVRTHKGEEFIYILSGEIVCILEGTEEYELEEGDSMYYSCSMPYKWKNISYTDEAKIMVVTLALTC